jgi:hypothetical protein
MGIIGKALDYGTPAGWVGLGAKKAGITDSTYGDQVQKGLDKGLESLDRSAKAEELYGGVDAAGMQLPHFDALYGGYGKLGRYYANQGSSFRGDQASLGNMLAQEARGNGVGQQLVGMQARQAADRASAQQFGAVAGARPGMQAMASRNAMLGSAMAQSAVGEQAALGSAQMTLGAQNAYGQHLQAARGADIAQQQANNQAQLEAYRQRLQAAQMQQQGSFAAEQARTQRYDALARMPTAAETAMGGLAGLGGAMFGRG